MLGKVTKWPLYSTGAGLSTGVKGNWLSILFLGQSHRYTYLIKRRVTVVVVGVGLPKFFDLAALVYTVA